MQNFSDEQKFQLEINKMFDIAENVVIKYIAKLLEEDISNIFVDEYKEELFIQEPLIFYPIKEYKEDKYLSFSLEIVPSEYKLDLTHLSEYEEITDGLDFIYKAVYEVFRTITNIGMKEEYIDKLLVEKSFHLQYDNETNTFIPIYIFPIKRRLMMCKEFLNGFTDLKNNTQAWENLSDEKQNEYNIQVQNVIHLVEHLQFDENEAKEKEIEINSIYQKTERIGIILQELSYDELPENFKMSICPETTDEKSSEEETCTEEIDRKINNN